VLSIEHEDSLLSADEGLTKAARFLNELIIREQPNAPWWLWSYWRGYEEDQGSHCRYRLHGTCDLEALRRTEGIEIAAVVGREAESAHKIARGFDVPSTTDLARVLGDSSIDAVHICTPNASHYTLSLSALKEGKHVLCEKPLSVSAAEAEELVSVAKDRGLQNCVCHNLRYYPLVQQMRTMRESGELGEILVAQGTYSQDGLLYETDWNWRIDSTTGGHFAPWLTSEHTGSTW
jgi:predicted dehydrogenase